jgi:hypothetical protein
VFEIDIVQNSQLFYKVFSKLYIRMNDAKGLELLSHIQGMSGLGHLLCHVDGRPCHMGRTNAAPPRILDSAWVTGLISGDEVSLEQWIMPLIFSRKLPSWQAPAYTSSILWTESFGLQIL